MLNLKIMLLASAASVFSAAAMAQIPAASVQTAAQAPSGTGDNAQIRAPDEAYLDYAKPEDGFLLPDGRRIQLVCMGQGSPTVILSAGMQQWGGGFRGIHKSIAEHTRVCTWDRPGFGFSDASPIPQTTEATTDDLEAVLTAAGVEGPYVMVGHSLGVYESMIFKDRHPEQVVGLVSIDGAVPDQEEMTAAVAPNYARMAWASINARLERSRQCIADIESGAIRPGGPTRPGCLGYPPTYPAAMSEAMSRLDSDPRRMLTQMSLTEQLKTSAARIVDPARSYGDMPLVVLIAGRNSMPPTVPADLVAERPLLTAEFQRRHEQVAALSSRGVSRVIPDARHSIHQDRPDVVIATVLEVLAAARSRGQAR